MIEFFTVAPEDEAAFIAAWRSAAPPGATLHRALGAEAPLRFAGIVDGGPDSGVLLIVAPVEDDFGAVLSIFSTRQGYVGSRLLRDPDGRQVAVVQWSSPLMYARTVRAEGDLIAALPLRADAALYGGSVDRCS